jgi:hypothetical protein
LLLRTFTDILPCSNSSPMNVGIRYSAFNKALTEYFIHNAKNSLSSSENILDQLASFRMETGLPAALRQDKKYQKAQKNCNKANEKMQDLNLTPQQWDAVDATITAENIASIEYIRIAYKQGIIDAFSILRKTL